MRRITMIGALVAATAAIAPASAPAGFDPQAAGAVVAVDAGDTDEQGASSQEKRHLSP